MAIERKKIVVKEDKKHVVSTAKKLKKSFNFASLPDAIIDGKFTCVVGTKIIVERMKNGRNILSICTIQEVSEKGLVHTYDETVEQCFSFSIAQPPNVVKVYE